MQQAGLSTGMLKRKEESERKGEAPMRWKDYCRSKLRGDCPEGCILLGSRSLNQYVNVFACGTRVAEAGYHRELPFSVSAARSVRPCALAMEYPAVEIYADLISFLRRVYDSNAFRGINHSHPSAPPTPPPPRQSSMASFPRLKPP